MNTNKNKNQYTHTVITIDLTVLKAVIAVIALVLHGLTIAYLFDEGFDFNFFNKVWALGYAGWLVKIISTFRDLPD